MVVSIEEIWVLSYYRASELTGALFLGRLARCTTDPELLVLLTEHFAEEAQHAWIWTDTIRRLGHKPIPITDSYQSRYSIEVGMPSSMPEFLALTHIVEKRAYEQFTRHANRADVHPIVKQTLVAMLKDEEQHLALCRASFTESRPFHGYTR
jgi:hypothetical protein